MRGTVIYLRASIEDLRQRTLRDTKRPLLQGGDPEKVLRALLETREPLYNGMAHITVDSGRMPSSKLTDEIIKKLSEAGRL
jgi:shikimate kinase